MRMRQSLLQTIAKSQATLLAGLMIALSFSVDRAAANVLVDGDVVVAPFFVGGTTYDIDRIIGSKPVHAVGWQTTGRDLPVDIEIDTAGNQFVATEGGIYQVSRAGRMNKWSESPWRDDLRSVDSETVAGEQSVLFALSDSTQGPNITEVNFSNGAHPTENVILNLNSPSGRRFLKDPVGLSKVPGGSLWVVDRGSGDVSPGVVKIDAQTEDQIRVATDGYLGDATDIATIGGGSNTDGAQVFVSVGDGTVIEVNPNLPVGTRQRVLWRSPEGGVATITPIVGTNDLLVMSGDTIFTLDTESGSPKRLGSYDEGEYSGFAAAMYGNGEHRATCHGHPITQRAIPGHTTVTGEDYMDSILGSAGSDTIRAHGGKDVVCGGDGGDTIKGAKGNDLLHGEAGNDSIYGGFGNDRIKGGNGSDGLWGGGGRDWIFGGRSFDWLRGGPGNDRLRPGRDGDFVRQ